MTYTVPAGRYGDYSTAFIQAYINEKVASVIDLAPDTLDTLNELAAAIGDDAAFFTTMANANAAIQADVDANEAASDAAEAALSTRLDALEADPTTATALAAIGVTATNARTALQTLLQNAIDAVQADVNTNEADADTAIALRATIESPTFTTKIASPEFHSAGSHLKFKADTNDIIFYPNNTETLQITRHSGTGHPTFTANGGSGEFKFNQITDLAGGVKLAGTTVTATAAELNYVDGVTSAIQTQLDALQTADAELTELATMATASAAAIADLAEAEIQILDGATVTTAELNLLDGVTATTAELNYVDGVTSAIQTQLNAIQADVDQNETDADTSLASLSTNINNEGAARLLADNANETHIDNMATLTGVAKDEVSLSTFTGSTIADNQTIKAALQALETAVETKQASDAELVELATMVSGAAAALADLTADEVGILDGATVTTAELNILDGVTSTAAELNILDGVTATAAELNYVDGVTSNVQTQLDAKLATSGAKAALDVDHLITLSGVSAAADDLGTFTGSTISDSRTAKQALQELETELETKADIDGVTFTGAVVQTPAASVTPGSNGQLMVEATNNTTLTFKLKGSDGTVRSGTITLS